MQPSNAPLSGWTLPAFVAALLALLALFGLGLLAWSAGVDRVDPSAASGWSRDALHDGEHRSTSR